MEYQSYRRISIVLILLMILLLFLPKWPAVQFTRWIVPVTWGIVIAAIVFFVPRVHPAGRLSSRGNFYIGSVICAVVLLIFRFAAGYFMGQLGESPYDHSPEGLLGNFLIIAPTIVGRELIRSSFLCTYYTRFMFASYSRYNVKPFVFIILVTTTSDLNFSTIGRIENLRSLTVFAATELGPALSQNIVLSYLALYGGTAAALFYIGILSAFHWMSPVLPILNWLTEGTIDILIPIVSILLLLKNGSFRAVRNKMDRSWVQKGEGLKWTLTAVLSIGLIWFVLGVFPIVPSLIATGSMEPMIYPGDVVLLKQIKTEDQIRTLKSGDVIQFQRDDILITHRIVSVIDDGLGNLTYRTKGDNNSTEDVRLVLPNEIKGTFICVIPKVGYPTLLLKSVDANGSKDVVF